MRPLGIVPGFDLRLTHITPQFDSLEPPAPEPGYLHREHTCLTTVISGWLEQKLSIKTGWPSPSCEKRQRATSSYETARRKFLRSQFTSSLPEDSNPR